MPRAHPKNCFSYYVLILELTYFVYRFNYYYTIKRSNASTNWVLCFQEITGISLFRKKLSFITYVHSFSVWLLWYLFTVQSLYIIQILPVVIFFSAVVSVLYFLGTMQIIIKSIAILLEFALGTTPIESFATAAHIFIGQVSLLVLPFID